MVWDAMQSGEPVLVAVVDVGSGGRGDGSEQARGWVRVARRIPSASPIAGTTDVSAIELQLTPRPDDKPKLTIKVAATYGDMLLGGTDIQQRVKAMLPPVAGVDAARMDALAEATMIRLATEDEVEVHGVTLTRAALELACAPELDRIQSAINAAFIKVDDGCVEARGRLKFVLPVGGPVNMPFVLKRIVAAAKATELAADSDVRLLDVSIGDGTAATMTAVARGASALCYFLLSPEAPVRVLFKDMVAHSVGIKCTGGEFGIIHHIMRAGMPVNEVYPPAALVRDHLKHLRFMSNAEVSREGNEIGFSLYRGEDTNAEKAEDMNYTVRFKVSNAMVTYYSGPDKLTIPKGDLRFMCFCMISDVGKVVFTIKLLDKSFNKEDPNCEVIFWGEEVSATFDLHTRKGETVDRPLDGLGSISSAVTMEQFRSLVELCISHGGAEGAAYAKDVSDGVESGNGMTYVDATKVLNKFLKKLAAEDILAPAAKKARVDAVGDEEVVTVEEKDEEKEEDEKDEDKEDDEKDG